MATLPHPSKLVLAAAAAIGVVATLASGELHADRDVDGELLRANTALERRLADQELALADALAEIDALRRDLDAANAKPKPNNPGTSPGVNPGSLVEKQAEEALAFRKKVLAAIASELEAIDTRATAIETKAAAAKATFDKHTHTVELVSHGWVKIDTMLDADHLDVVRASYRDNFLAIRDPDNGGTGTYDKTTSKPK